MKKTLSRHLSQSILIAMLVVTVLFLAIGIPIQTQQRENSMEMICFSLNTLVSRDHDNLANELFEHRLPALELRLREISRVRHITSIALYDQGGTLLRAAPEGVQRPRSINIRSVEPDEAQYHAVETGEGLVFTRPVRALGRPLGWLEIVYDTSAVRWQTVQFYMLFGGLLLMTLACMYGFLRRRVQRLIIDPLDRLVTLVEGIQPGNVLPAIDTSSDAAEVAELVAAFANMSERLRLSYDELDQKNAQLLDSLEESARSSQAFRESEARFRAIVDQAPVGIMLFDNDGIVTSANEFFAAMMGAPAASAIVGLDMFKMPYEGVRRTVRDAIATGEGRFEDYYTSITGGKRVYIRVRLKRFSEKLLCGVFEDLTEQKTMLEALATSEQSLSELNRDLERTVDRRTHDLARKAEELERANERLRELDSLKTSFLSAVSHELRTPLTSILGFAKVTEKNFSNNFMVVDACDEALLEKGRQIRRNLQIIGSEGGRLSRLVNDLLDLARIESGRMSWNDARISPAEVLRDAVEAAAMDYEDTDVELVTDIQVNSPCVWMDADKLFQVVRNLLHNAAKFTARGTVRAVLQSHDAQVELRVEDSGTGIPESELEAVFERFHQVESAGNEGAKPQGSGLGLAISRQIVEHYGGRIWAESVEGEGSVFRVVLPALDSCG